MKHIGIFILSLFTLQLSACSCGSIKDLNKEQNESYESHNLIFIGNPISYDEKKHTYLLEVVEVLKGNYKDSIITGKYYDSCSSIPLKEQGMWLIYTSKNGRKPINIESCGLSRSFKYPFLFNRKAGIPLPPYGMDYSVDPVGWTLDWEINLNHNRAKALVLLREEIDNIRYRGF